MNYEKLKENPNTEVRIKFVNDAQYTMLRERISKSKPAPFVRAKRFADRYLRENKHMSPNAPRMKSQLESIQNSGKFNLTELRTPLYSPKNPVMKSVEYPRNLNSQLAMINNRNHGAMNYASGIRESITRMEMIKKNAKKRNEIIMKKWVHPRSRTRLDGIHNQIKLNQANDAYRTIGLSSRDFDMVNQMVEPMSIDQNRTKERSQNSK